MVNRKAATVANSTVHRFVRYFPAVTAKPASLDVCVVCHTHWDREWYHPLGRFRQRLVPLIDSLISPPGQGHSAPFPFLLDGQAITLLDYLSVRPEREAALRDRLQSGGLEAGPWFVLADNLIPSGEAILRNLEAGRRTLQRFGVQAPRVLYCPDTFGHPAALPSIAAGYGFPVAVVWRGYGGPSHPATDAFRWTAADGAAVVTHHLPPDGYEVGSVLPTDPHHAALRWSRLLALFRSRNHTGVVLLPNGADHHALQPDIDAALHAMNAAAAHDGTVQRTTLAHFADRFAHAAADTAIPEVHGELRDSYGYTWTLGGTLATRAHQKQRNARLERRLVRDVEPWIALAWLLEASPRARATASDGQITLAQLPSLLHAAWQELLETHPHDTLCGCSTDGVARAMNARQDSVHAQASGLRAAALDLLLQRNPVAARARTVTDNVVVIRNRTAAPRGGIVELRLTETLGDVTVGPGGANAPYPDVSAHRRPSVPGLHMQWLGQRTQQLRRESPQHYPDNDLVRIHRAIAWAPTVPAYGLRVIRHASAAGTSYEPAPHVELVQSADAIVLRNGNMRVIIRDGCVSVQQAGREIDDLFALETITDLGDSYTPSLRGAGERLRCITTRVLHRGPLRAAVHLRWQSHARDITVDTVLVLDADAEHLRFDVRGRNRKLNHRLQLQWRTGLPVATTIADAAFGPVPRQPAVAPPASREAVVPTMPMHRWAAHIGTGQSTGQSTVQSTVLLSDGLAEAQSAPGMLAVTLLRAIGQLSKHDLPERPGHAGWPTRTPGAQSMGACNARFGFMLAASHDEHEVRHAISTAADRLLLPLVGSTVRDLDLTHTPQMVRGVALVGNAFELSAITLAERHEGVVLRAVNLTSHDAHGCWQLPHEGPWLVHRCRLDETPLSDPVPVGAQVAFTAAPREIVTLVVTLVATNGVTASR